MPGFDNGTMFANNVDFTGNSSVAAQVTSNGQLLIGSAVSPNIRVGTLTAGTGVSITNGNGTITIGLSGGGTALEHLTGDTGGALNPDGSNNINIVGGTLSAGTNASTTSGAGSTLTITSINTAKWIVDPTANRGTHQTIASAITAASSGQTIFIRPGTYTENLTLKAGVNLTAFVCDAQNPNVTIVGKATYTSAGTVVISGIRLQTNSDFVLSLTGATASSTVILNGCYLNATNNTLLSNTKSAGPSTIACYNCFGDLTTTGIAYFSVTAGELSFQNCNFTNTGSSTTASTFSAATASQSTDIFCSNITNAMTSSSSSAFSLFSSEIIGALILGSTNTHTIYSSLLIGGASSAASISVGAGLVIVNSTINSSNTNALTGAGSISYSGLAFTGSSSLINTTTQTPLVFSNDAVKVTTPGAYPYTTIPQDAVILVDSSSARTIIPLASPTTGQMHRIKDNAGSAGTNNITITPSGKNIDGVASFVINTNYGSADIVYNGTQWNVL